MYKDDKRKMWIKEITIKITMKNVKVSTCTIAACVGLTRRLKNLLTPKYPLLLFKLGAPGNAS